MSSITPPVALVYKNEVKYLLSNALKVLTIQVVFNISTSSIYLQDIPGTIYFPNFQGDFTDIDKDILLIQPFTGQVKLETICINITDGRFVYSNGDFNHEYLTTGYNTYRKNMRKSIIRFDNLKSLNGKKIVKAYLRLTGKEHEYSSTSQKEVFAHRIEENYGKITKWIETPAYNPEPCASIKVKDLNGEIFSFDITLLVKGWIDEIYPNYGILLRQNDPFGEDSSKFFYLLYKPPYLNIIYING